MTALEQHVPEYVLEAIRDPALRRHHAGAVYAEVWAYLSFETAKPVKVRQTAKRLRIRDRTKVRRALDLLVTLNYLDFSHVDSKCIRHYRKHDRRGAQRSPLTFVTTDDGP